MFELILFMLLAYGASNILVYGEIFAWLRNFLNKASRILVVGLFFGFLYKMITCMMCVSVWVGMFFSYLFIKLGTVTPFTSYGIEEFLVVIFLDGLITSGVVWLIHTIQEKIER